jgi:hypothetical protein
VFTLDAPVYVQSPPVVTPPPILGPSSTTRPKPRKRVLKPAIYDVKTVLPKPHGGQIILYVTFRVRRPVTVGVDALRGRAVVAFSGMQHFNGGTGRLALRLNRAHWPTGLKFVTPKSHG